MTGPLPVGLEMTRILFVDDEINILQGLRRLLRPFAQNWVMDFASSGDEALAKLAAAPADVVVSDMRMPGMDGAQLLERVRHEYPQTMRIILSGYSDREVVLRSIGAAHRYLAKPCTPDALRQAIQASERARTTLRQDTVRTMVSEMNCVPSLPSAYEALMHEFESPNASLVRVAEIVERDPGMTAQVLRVCNSLLFGLRTEVSSAPMAVTLMGLRTVASLFLSMQIFKQFDVTSVTGLELEAVCDHSLSTAWLAREIARAEGCSSRMAEDAFTAALLHDVGKLLLGLNFPDLYREVVTASAAGHATTAEAERAVFGADHAEVGAFLLNLWGLPQLLVDAVAQHHSLSPGRPVLNVTTVVHIADALDAEHRGELRSGLDASYLASLGLVSRLDAWRQLRSTVPGTTAAIDTVA